jgi:SOS-response transcriptional repressor LexA
MHKVGHIAVGRRGTRDKVWSFLRVYMKASEGRPPTVREIQRGTGLPSLSVVQRSLGALERDGLIRRAEFGKTRGIRIIGATYRLPDEESEAI